MEERKGRRKRDRGGGREARGKKTDFVFRTRVGRVGQDEERTKKCARAFDSGDGRLDIYDWSDFCFVYRAAIAL